MDEEKYRRDITEILNFLSGRTGPVLKRLEGRMKSASENMEYEEAVKWRDAVSAVKALSETQRVTMIGEHDLDVCLAVKEGSKTFVVVFPVRGGKLSGRETFPIQADPQDSKADFDSFKRCSLFKLCISSMIFFKFSLSFDFCLLFSFNFTNSVSSFFISF